MLLSNLKSSPCALLTQKIRRDISTKLAGQQLMQATVNLKTWYLPSYSDFKQKLSTETSLVLCNMGEALWLKLQAMFPSTVVLTLLTTSFSIVQEAGKLTLNGLVHTIGVIKSVPELLLSKPQLRNLINTWRTSENKKRSSGMQFHSSAYPYRSFIKYGILTNKYGIRTLATAEF